MVIFIKFKKFLFVLLALISVIALSILPASAVSVPDYDITDDNYNYYILLKYSNGTEAVYLSFDKLVVSQESNYVGLYSKNGNTKVINITKNTSNLYTSPGLLGSIYLDTIYSSNYDIKYADSDEVFFPPPLTLLERLYNQVPQGVGEKVTADMATLTVFGIGLIALLVGLYLVPKVLHKFQI